MPPVSPHGGKGAGLALVPPLPPLCPARLARRGPPPPSSPLGLMWGWCEGCRAAGRWCAAEGIGFVPPAGEREDSVGGWTQSSSPHCGRQRQRREVALGVEVRAFHAVDEHDFSGALHAPHFPTGRGGTVADGPSDLRRCTTRGRTHTTGLANELGNGVVEFTCPASIRPGHVRRRPAATAAKRLAEMGPSSSPYPWRPRRRTELGHVRRVCSTRLAVRDLVDHGQVGCAAAKKKSHRERPKVDSEQTLRTPLGRRSLAAMGPLGRRSRAALALGRRSACARAPQDGRRGAASRRAARATLERRSHVAWRRSRATRAPPGRHSVGTKGAIAP